MYESQLCIFGDLFSLSFGCENDRLSEIRCWKKGVWELKVAAADLFGMIDCPTSPL